MAPVTVCASEQFARRFLAGRVSAGDPCGVLGITAGEVNAFLVRECARVSSGSAGCCTYRLRSLLRYLAVRGRLRRSRTGACGSPGRALARGDDPAVPDATGDRPAPRPVRPPRVEVHVEANNGLLDLRIRDDGIGGADPARGSGLIGLGDRVAALGGTIKIASPQNKGTSVHVELPLEG
jgi:hypothetical protein